MNSLTTTDIQKLKNKLVHYINMNKWNNNSMMDIRDNYCWIVNMVSEANVGFASEIAKTVDVSGKCSEKQAYHIAKAACEMNLNIDFEL